MSDCECNDELTIVGGEFTYKGKKYQVLTSEEGSDALQEMIKRLNEIEKKEPNTEPVHKRTGFERCKGSRYYIANDDYAYYDDDDPDFDNMNYNAGNYYGTEELAKNMSRALNLTAKLIRFAAEHDGVGSFKDGYEIDLICGSLVALKANCAPACTPLFGNQYIAEMAIEEFREDLMWYFDEFLPAMKENKYV